MIETAVHIELVYSIGRIYIMPIRIIEVSLPWLIPTTFKLIDSAEAERESKQSDCMFQTSREKQLLKHFHSPFDCTLTLKI